MADIVSVEKKIADDRVGFAHVNNVLRFNKDSALPSFYSDINFMGDTVRIYPAPDNSYYYNAIYWLSAQAGRFGFIDDLDINIEANGVVYDWTDRALLRGNMDVIVFLESGDQNIILNTIYMLNGLLQVEDYHKRFPLKFKDSDVFLLHPFIDGNNRASYVKYWTGYPLDVTIHKSEKYSKVQLLNTENTAIFTGGDTSAVYRFVFSDGRTDVGLSETLNLIEGINNIEVLNDVSEIPFTIFLDNQTCFNKGHYIKWINSLGGYSYWLFHNGDRSRKTSDLDEIQNDFENIEDTINPTISLGKNSNDELRVAALGLTPMQNSLFSDLMDSPGVWLFTGQPFNQNTFNDWLGIRVKTNSVKVANAKQPKTNYELTLELPQRYTRKL